MQKNSPELMSLVDCEQPGIWLKAVDSEQFLLMVNITRENFDGRYTIEESPLERAVKPHHALFLASLGYPETCRVCLVASDKTGMIVITDDKKNPLETYRFHVPSFYGHCLNLMDNHRANEIPEGEWRIDLLMRRPKNFRIRMNAPSKIKPNVKPEVL